MGDEGPTIQAFFEIRLPDSPRDNHRERAAGGGPCGNIHGMEATPEDCNILAPKVLIRPPFPGVFRDNYDTQQAGTYPERTARTMVYI